jgi:hypothetical protein
MLPARTHCHAKVSEGFVLGQTLCKLASALVTNVIAIHKHHFKCCILSQRMTELLARLTAHSSVGEVKHAERMILSKCSSKRCASHIFQPIP